jgi:hypothetical protein
MFSRLCAACRQTRDAHRDPLKAGLGSGCLTLLVVVGLFSVASVLMHPGASPQPDNPAYTNGRSLFFLLCGVVAFILTYSRVQSARQNAKRSPPIIQSSSVPPPLPGQTPPLLSASAVPPSLSDSALPKKNANAIRGVPRFVFYSYAGCMLVWLLLLVCGIIFDLKGDALLLTFLPLMLASIFSVWILFTRKITSGIFWVIYLWSACFFPFFGFVLLIFPEKDRKPNQTNAA